MSRKRRRYERSETPGEAALRHARVRRKQRLAALREVLPRADAQLARNWAAHVVLVFVSFAALPLVRTRVASAEPASSLLQAVARRQLGFELDDSSVSALLAGLLLLHSTRYGYLVSRFLLVRLECDHLSADRDGRECADWCDPPPQSNAVRPHDETLHETTNFFEPLLPGFRRKNPVLATSVLACGIVVLALSHALMTAHWLESGRCLAVVAGSPVVASRVAACAAALILFTCYFQLSRSSAGRLRAIRVAIPCAITGWIALLLWLWFGR